MSDVSAIRVVGGVIPPSLLGHLESGILGSQQSRAPGSYHLTASESVRDAASRAWTYLRGAWAGWRDADQQRPDGAAGTGPARERWLLPLLRELGYGQIPSTGGGIVVEDANYPISHRWQHVPVHLLGPGVDLDRRNPGVAGAARAPQAMVQELLNRTDEHLWAVLANGPRLRLLRDSTALVGSAYVEFDLEAIFDGELYAQWLLLFQLAHVSRLEVRSDEDPASCWLEEWRDAAAETGARALGRLEEGVERALTALGSGFLAHPANVWLVRALRDGQLDTRVYQRALLRLVYRLLFVFVAEDRGLLLDPRGTRVARDRYDEYFSTARLRRLSRIRAGGPHPDLWRAQRMVLRALGTEGLTDLALAPLGGVFGTDAKGVVPADAPDADDLFWGAELSNHDLLTAVEHLAWITVDGGRTQQVDYRHLGAEELGSVYEALLELHPDVDLDEHRFAVDRVAGNDRKTTGSYYTPPELVSALLDTALDPVIAQAAPLGADPDEAEAALLDLTICDPACGSGGFLVAGARRIAARLAELRAGEGSPTPELVHQAMRDVVGQCVYGVDINDLAAELAKVSLWLEALEPGRPLSFLDARIRVGNALVGTTPALLEAGVPTSAFKELDGDNKTFAGQIRKRNKDELKGQDVLWGGTQLDLTALADEREGLLTNVDTIDEVEGQRKRWETMQQSTVLNQLRTQADAWCASFFWPIVENMPLPPTSAVVRDLGSGSQAYGETVDEVERLADEHGFFHWHLEFPEVFTSGAAVGPDGWSGGFSCMVGNPPWERVKLQEQEFFASRDPDIANAPNASKRRTLIKALQSEDPPLYSAYKRALHAANGRSAFMRTSGRYPLNGRGDVNTYAVFTELFRSLTGPDGHAGVIAPTGIATDATTQHFFKDLVQTKSLAALYDFENAKPLFDGVHRSFKFCLLAMAGRDVEAGAAKFAFFLHDPSQITSHEFALTPEEITLLNPNTGTCPIFRTRRDAEITLGIYRRVPVLIKEDDPDGNPWGISFMTMFHMSNDSGLFRTRDELEDDGWSLEGNVFHRGSDTMLPLYEAKMIHHFDHRWATYERDGSIRNVTVEEKQDPDFRALPRYWVATQEVDSKVEGRWDSPWLMGWRDICRATDERTTIASIVGKSASPEGGTLLCLPSSQSASEAGLLLASFDSFAFDFAARQKVGGTHLKYFTMRQLPVPNPTTLTEPLPFGRVTWDAWIGNRVKELTCAATDMSGVIDGGDVFVWDPVRRPSLRAELDAAFFHLYGVPRDDVDYIMDTFPIVKRKDIAEHGEYRTKRLILEVYDAMQRAIDTGTEYQTILDPPPGDGPRHPAKER